ncbi:sensor histidine kinase [Ilyomonas limi]|uniref:histidine kinase n=1 Tax=Ilyomonas limi TaxID=2575867 RepID=A0A4U3LC24_9BACT|nr:sensor histidine kinase [Ilyomonas limi]TKK71616.1 sensor histidine kinase [Ilyomonas limi]
MANNLPHFNISAAVVKQLGEELVTDEVTAIMELVKNSYDADSKWVRINVDTKNALDDEKARYKGDIGYIIIDDAGDGMTAKDITEGWLIISLSKKREMKAKGETTVLGRTPLGDKGLGRLSTQRLAHRLEMFTSKKEETHINHIAFDWNDFKEETPLTEVEIFSEVLPKIDTEKGTKLILTELRDANSWEGKSGSRFIGQLSQLIFPFKEKRTFHVFLTINGEKIDFDEINEALRSQAVSRFQFVFNDLKLQLKGQIKNYKLFGGSTKVEDKEDYEKLISVDDGKNFYNFLTDKIKNKKHYIDNVKYHSKEGYLLEFSKSIDIQDISGKALISDQHGKEIFANPGDFSGEIDDFNLRESDTLSSTFDSFSQYKEIVKNQTGVRVYRDGFGVKPFGIDGDDWLKLGSGQTSGGSFYTLRPRNTMGFVAISAKENKCLQEKTDREGFVDSQYSQNFFLLMNRVVAEINGLLEKTRRSYNDYKTFIAQQSGNINSIKDSYNRLQDTAAKAKKLQDENSRVSISLSRISSAVKEVIAKVKDIKPKNVEDAEQRKLLQDIDILLDDAKRVMEQVNTILEVAKKLEHDANYIKPKIDDLENQLSEFAELAGLGLTAEALSHEISNIVDRLLDQTNALIKRIKGKETVSVSSINLYIEYVKTAIQSFRKQLSHLAPSLRYVREAKQEFSLKEYFDEVGSYYIERFKDDIKLSIVIKQDFKVRMSKGKLTQVIDNIIINSDFWLRERKKSFNDFKPNVTIEIDEPFLRIYDNGLGIDPTLEDRIFQPFITAKPRNQGRGLGLFIVQQLLETVGAEVLLLNQRNENNRRYIFQINFTTAII